MTAAELRRRAAQSRAAAKKIVDKAESEDRELTPEEETDISGFRGEVESYERRASVAEEFEPDVSSGSARIEERSGVHASSIEPVEGEGDKRRSFGHWLQCVDAVCDNRADYRDAQESRETLGNLYCSQYRAWDTTNRSKEVRGLSAASGTAGGFLMPVEFYRQLMEVAAPMSIVRPRAFVIPMGAQEIEVPSLDQTTAQTAGNPPYFGGVVLDWTAAMSGATTTATQPGFRKTKLTLSELTGYCPVPRGLISRSAISLEPLLFRLMGGAVAYAEDYAFLRGNGVGKPTGVLNAPCKIITSAARGSATAISFANATAVWTRVIDQESQSRGVWLVSKSAESAVLTMTGSSNAVFHPTGVYTAGSETMNAGPSGVMLFMRPVLVTAKLPAINVDGDFGFYDFSKYIIGDGGPPEVATSDDYLFRTNERAFRIVHNVAGAPWMNGALTLEDGSTTVSPFVTLKIQ